MPPRRPLVSAALVLALALTADCSKHPFAPSTSSPVDVPWEQTSGPSHALVWDLTTWNPGPVLIAGTVFGIARSTDLGASWQKVDDLPVVKMARTYANVFAAGLGGVKASSDGGRTWSWRTNGLPPGAVWMIADRDSLKLFAGVSRHGLYVSTDQGATWTVAGTGIPSDATPTAYLKGGAGVSGMFVGTREGHVYRSTDEGATWVPAESGLPGNEVTALGSRGSRMFAAESYSGIWVSEDDGGSWTQPTPANFWAGAFEVSGTQVYAAGSQGLHVSEGGIGPWTLVPATTATSMSMTAANSDLFVGTEYGVLRAPAFPDWTSNGPPSEPVLVGPPLSPVFAVAEIDGMLFGGTSPAGLHRSTDFGATWKSDPAPVERPHGFTAIGTHLFALDVASVLRSDDGGTTWLDAGGSNLPRTDAMELTTDGTALLARWRDAGAFRSTDLGQSWQAVTVPSSPVTAIAALPGNFLLAAADHSGSLIFRSIDQGATWRQVGLIGGSIVRALASNGKQVYAGGDRIGVVVSTDVGHTWGPTRTPLPNVESLAAGGTHVAALTVSGEIWLSSDHGSFWSRQVEGLGDARPLSIAAGADRWYLGTTAGVWRRPY